jgi:(2Fe-2S) ferredoxin
MSDPYYKHHVFFCVNQRDDGGQCCQDCGAMEMRNYAKKRCKELGIHTKGGVRINSAGCLNRCSEGPVIVVYPEGTWYTYVDQEDIDQIIDDHLLKGNVVKRLQLPEL